MKPRDQVFRVEGVNFLRSQTGDVLSVDNATFVSGAAAGSDDSTITFEQSASLSGESYIKINFGTSTTTAAGGVGRCAKYYFWDTGYKINDYPMISLTMDCSGANETDLTAVTASTSMPAVAYGFVIYTGSVVPIMRGGTGRWNDTYTKGGTSRYTAWRMGKATDRVNWDSNEGDNDNFGFTNGSNAANGTAEGCRGFRMQAIGMTFRRNTGANVFYRWMSVGYSPGNNCDGNNEQSELVTTGDLPGTIPPEGNNAIYIFVAAANTATGGGPSTFAGIFKARVI